MHHILFQGGLGTGKTFMMSLFAKYLREEAAKAGVTINLFSNYDMNDAYTMKSYEDWYKVAESDASIVCWDEAQICFNNRAWSRFGQGIATEVAMYARKMRAIQIYATPNVNNVDNRIRDIIEVVVTMQKIEKQGFRLHFQDYQTKEKIRTAWIPMSVAKKIFKLNLYDTYGFVRGFPLPDNEDEAEEFWETLDTIHKRKMGITYRRGLTHDKE